MSWKIRPATGLSTEEELSRRSNKDAFTIKMNHFGKFRLCKGKKCYVGGKTSYVDYCKKEELSVEDFSYMAAEIGATGWFEFYFSCNLEDNCETLVHLTSGYHIEELSYYTGELNYVSIFIDHEILDENLIVMSPDGVHEKNTLPVVDEVGSPVEKSLHDTTEVVTQGDEDVTQGERISDGMSRLFDEQVDEVDSEGERSMGEDSENSDYMEDSDGCYDDEYDDFHRYVDFDDELGKCDSKGKRPKTRSQYVQEKEITLKKGVESQRKKPAANTHEGFKLFNPRTDMDIVDFHVGMCFKDIPTFRAALKRYAVQNGRTLIFPLNCPMKVKARCKAEKCPWLIYGSRVPTDDTVRVKTLNDTHTCVRQENVIQADSRYISELYKRKLKSDPNWNVDSMVEVIQGDLGCLVSRWKMYRVKHKVANMDSGDELEQFASLYRYAEEIFRSNPNSTCKIKTSVVGDKAVFKRMYICWDALKSGMLDGCRRLICLDGCHLKTHVGGVMLTAVGLDSNNGMYPFAYAVVEKETYKSWLWFLDLVVKDLGISERDSHKWTVMSDKQKGLVEAVSVKLPNCESRHCVRHLYANFKLSHKGVALKDLVWRAARATRVVDFQRILNESKTKSPSAFDWMAKRSPQHWSKAYFNTMNNTDIIVNNISESFNSMIVKPRGKPIIKLLEDIRRILMKRIGVKRKDMLKHSGDLCPNIQKILDKNKVKSYGWAPMWNGKQEFEVRGPGDQFFCVHLGDKTCGCRKWQLTGIPCEHAISCLNYMGYKPETYVEECYSKETYLRIYDHYMHPLQSMEEWPAPPEERLEIVPPKSQKMPGRPKKNKRKLEPDEVIGTKKNGKLRRSGLISTCQSCKKQGHNSRTCPLKTGKTAKANEGLDIPPPTSASQPTGRNARKKLNVTSASQPTRSSPKKKVNVSSASQPTRIMPNVTSATEPTSAKQNVKRQVDISLASQSLVSRRSSHMPLFTSVPRGKFKWIQGEEETPN